MSVPNANWNNLASYKLQDVASHFIGDSVSTTTPIGAVEVVDDDAEETKTPSVIKTLIKSKNLKKP